MMIRALLAAAIVGVTIPYAGAQFGGMPGMPGSGGPGGGFRRPAAGAAAAMPGAAEHTRPAAEAR